MPLFVDAVEFAVSAGKKQPSAYNGFPFLANSRLVCSSHFTRHTSISRTVAVNKYQSQIDEVIPWLAFILLDQLNRAAFG